jgi:hypothetical protein
MNADSRMTMMKGTTPATLSLSASNGFFDGADYVIEFSKDGYDTQTFPLSSGVDGWYIANILFGGLLGLLIIDPATGAMWKLDENVLVSLSRTGGESASIMTIDQVPEHLLSKMERIQ